MQGAIKVSMFLLLIKKKFNILNIVQASDFKVKNSYLQYMIFFFLKVKYDKNDIDIYIYIPEIWQNVCQNIN